MKKRLSNRITIRLDDDLREAIAAKAEEQRTDFNKIVREGLKKLFPSKPKTKPL